MLGTHSNACQLEILALNPRAQARTGRWRKNRGTKAATRRPAPCNPIHGRDEADAERKLRQMYLHCEILERSVMQPAVMQPSSASTARGTDGTSFEEIVALISK